MPIGKDADLTLAGPFGCGFQTGAGGVLNVLRPSPGSSIAVFGAEAVGVSAILAAVLSGCSTVAAVDLNAERLTTARSLGATHGVTGGDGVAEELRSIAPDGFDFVVDTTGRADVLRTAVEALGPLGRCGVIGVGPSAEMTFDWRSVLNGRTITGIIGGGAVPQIFMPELLRLHAAGRFPVDEIVAHFPFERIGEAIDARAAARSARPSSPSETPSGAAGQHRANPCASGAAHMTTHFDHHSAECTADPVSYYAAYRETCPVGRTTAHGGFVYTTRYADVSRIARDDDGFSSSRASTGVDGVAIVIPSGPGLEQYPIELDPPRSTGFRDLINPLLTPAAVDRLRPMIARHAARAVDAFIELGSADFVRDLTNPVPAAVTLDWLGFPEEDWARLAGPIHDIFAAPAGSERAMRGAQGLAYMEERIRELIRDRRAEPGRDAVSFLATARDADGEPLGEDELVSVIGLLIAGGVDTTTSLTGSVLVHLSRNPEQRRRLIESPDLLERATEEFLRAFAPSQSMARTALADTEVGGCPVRAGERVLIPWVAANHDPAVFTDPHEVRLDRDASRHLSFGIGSHRCAGAHMARAMFREMMTQVLTRLPDFRVLEDGLIGYPSSGNQKGWDAIPAVFTPARAPTRPR